MLSGILARAAEGYANMCSYVLQYPSGTDEKLPLCVGSCIPRASPASPLWRPSHEAT